MDFVKLAARVAGKPMLMMRDMGYNPKMLVYNTAEALGTKAKAGPGDWDKIHRQVNESIIKAWKGAGLKDPGPHVRDKRMDDDPRNIIHELEHLILDPDFDLDEGKSSNHSGTESVIEEVLSWGLAGDVEDDARFIVGDGAPDYLWPDAKTVREAIDTVTKAPITNKVRSQIRDSAVHALQKKYGAVPGESLDEEGEDGTVLRWDMAHAFVKAVESKCDDWKQIMEEELEDKWRNFNLRLKAEMQKLAPGVHSKSPKQVREEQQRLTSS